MRVARIIALCIAAAVIYGICHDQVTARICPEYFTIGHPPLIRTDSPTLLGLAWGTAATWWVGLFLGLALAAAATAGPWPKYDSRRLFRLVLLVMVCTAGLALVAGSVGHALALRGSVFLLEPLASRVPSEKHVGFLTDLWAHNTSYFGGFLGGVLACYHILRDRARRAFLEKHPGRTL
ncbi:MAG: hypothetical protein ACYC6Y_19480 [Thermoguttaceae bacterium]